MKKILILLILLTVAFPAMIPAKCKIKPPTKKSLEAEFGKPVKCYPEGMICFDKLKRKVECPKESGRKLCFQNARSGFTANFDNAGKILSIVLSHPCKYYSIKEFAEKLVPPENRGKFIKKIFISEEYACLMEYVEEYECLKINYSSQNCMGCAPGSVTITWN